METTVNSQIPYSHPQLDENMKFFVANMAFTLTPEQVRDCFVQFGPVHFVKIIYDKNGKSKGYGFVYMQNSEGAQAVEEYATKMGFRVEMYGRKNIQLHKHMKDRTNVLSRQSSSSSSRPFRDSTMYSMPSPISTLTQQPTFYNADFNTSPMLFSSHIIPPPQTSFSSIQHPDSENLDSHNLYSGGTIRTSALSDPLLPYYYTTAPLNISNHGNTILPYYQGGMYHPSNQVAHNTAYFLSPAPMYTTLTTDSTGDDSPTTSVFLPKE